MSCVERPKVGRAFEEREPWKKMETLRRINQRVGGISFSRHKHYHIFVFVLIAFIKKVGRTLDPGNGGYLLLGHVSKPVGTLDVHIIAYA